MSEPKRIAFDTVKKYAFENLDSLQNDGLQELHRAAVLSPYTLLYSVDGKEIRAVTIAEHHQTKVHGNGMKSTEGAFMIVRAIDNPFLSSNDEPIEQGSFLKWDLHKCTDKLGRTIGDIMQRYRVCISIQIFEPNNVIFKSYVIQTV